MRRLTACGLAGARQDASDKRISRADESRSDAEQGRLEYQKAHIAEDQKTERLRQVRLAKEEHDRRVAAGNQKPTKRPAGAPAQTTFKALDRIDGPGQEKALAVGKRGAQVAKDHAVKAIRKALESIDATDEVKAERKGKLVDRPATGRLRKPLHG